VACPSTYIREQLNITPKWANNHLSGGALPLRGPAFFIASSSLLIALFFISLYLLSPESAIQLISVDKVITIPASVQSELYLDYTHSVAKSPVREVFIITEKEGFQLIRTEHSAFGAGLPTENFGVFIHESGIYTNSGIDKVLTEIPVRVGAVANHRLIFDKGPEITLSDFFKIRSLVTIKPVRISRLHLFFSGGITDHGESPAKHSGQR
jgi:hypothetical protein